MHVSYTTYDSKPQKWKMLMLFSKIFLKLHFNENTNRANFLQNKGDFSLFSKKGWHTSKTRINLQIKATEIFQLNCTLMQICKSCKYIHLHINNSVTQTSHYNTFHFLRCHCTKKWSFTLRIFSVTVTNSAVFCAVHAHF